MQEVKGYKGFTTDLKNEAGDQFEVGKIYRTSNDDNLIFGTNGNEYHFCENLEDCFVYFDPNKSKYAEVTGLEEVRTTDNDYLGIYGIYLSRSIRIDKILTSEEIIERYLYRIGGISDMSLKRFIQLYHPLTEEQIIQFERKLKGDFGMIQDIMYYQRNIKNAYSNFQVAHEYQKKLIKKYESSE